MEKNVFFVSLDFILTQDIFQEYREREGWCAIMLTIVINNAYRVTINST